MRRCFAGHPAASRLRIFATPPVSAISPKAAEQAIGMPRDRALIDAGQPSGMKRKMRALL